MLGLPAILATAIPDIIGYFSNSTNNAKAIEDKKLDLQELIVKSTQKQYDDSVQLAAAQIALNTTMAQAGKLGWRDWLGKGLTVVLLFFLAQVSIAFGANWICGLFGHPLPQLTAAIAAFPYDIMNSIWNMLGMLLGGLYVGRGIEKSQNIKSAAVAQQSSFNTSLFFSTLKSLKGNLSQAEVDALNIAISKATS